MTPQSVTVFQSSFVGAGTSAPVVVSQGFQGVLCVAGTVFQGGNALILRGLPLPFVVSTSKVFANGAVFMPMYFPAGEYQFFNPASSAIGVHVSIHPTP